MFDASTTESTGWAGTVTTAITAVAGLLTLLLTNYLKRRKKADEAESTHEDVFADIEDANIKAALLHLAAEQDMSSKKLLELLNLHGGAFWESDEGGQCIYASDELAELIGVDKSSVMENGWITSLEDGQREQVVAAWNAAVAQRRDFNMDYTFVHRNRFGKVVKKVTVNGRATAIKNKKGEMRYIGVLTELRD